MNRKQKLKRCCIVGLVALSIAGLLTPIADALGLLVQVVALCAYAVTVFYAVYARVLKYQMDCESGIRG